MTKAKTKLKKRPARRSPSFPSQSSDLDDSAAPDLAIELQAFANKANYPQMMMPNMLFFPTVLPNRIPARRMKS